jgi:hypothetical protein
MTAAMTIPFIGLLLTAPTVPRTKPALRLAELRGPSTPAAGQAANDPGLLDRRTHADPGKGICR